jgi:hypothetical protein
MAGKGPPREHEFRCNLLITPPALSFDTESPQLLNPFLDQSHCAIDLWSRHEFSDAALQLVVDKFYRANSSHQDYSGEVGAH